MKCQILFSRKNKKNYFKMSSAEIFTQHAVLIVEEKHMLWVLIRSTSSRLLYILAHFNQEEKYFQDMPCYLGLHCSCRFVCLSI